ncbi:MAG: bifunctional phosphopantothenoylcysteine decarboxylase/phosphopantothenate--cysteine ligase CoaBC [Nitrospirae bacterium]|nr:bifunctional phosphopantothenoylcysteine decarboxylase/phosphopantothenate--cysteine ligase CoaBC [Nitrospirota bacterium]MBF0591612.1 bifunctional phosphopantothenoylcysteine decarboxylase/phosphopantothenate--cysteine ligase CoaBC [Nitrospirota bacterium]
MAHGRDIILAVTASIAAYKAPELVRALQAEGMGVNVVMTRDSGRFVAPLTLEILSGQRVLSDTFDAPLAHVEMAQEADALLVAPATLNTISKFAAGIADNLVTTLFTTFRGAVLVAPAMNWRMYEGPIFRDKLQYLKDKGVIEVPPEVGELACGEQGTGRMASIPTIIHALRKALTAQDLNGLRVVVTGGATRQFIDPVRFITNRSSGKMGFALARAASLRGADVTLVSGPTNLTPLKTVKFIPVETAQEMETAVIDTTRGADVLVMSAAVSDFRPVDVAATKLERSNGLSLNLVKTDDILSRLSADKDRPFIVGFAAETGSRIDRAREKLRKKGIDMIVFNDITVDGAGFDTDTNIVTIITSQDEHPLSKMSKEDVSHVIFNKVLQKLGRPALYEF